MHKVWKGVAVGAAAFALLASQVQAATTPIPGKIALVKTGKLAKIVAKPSGPDFPLPTAPVTAASIDFFDTSGAGGVDNYDVSAGSWSGLGNPAGSVGWKYKGTKAAGDPCVVVLIKEKVIKAVCKGADVTIDGPFGGDIGVIINTDADVYCARVPPATKNEAGLVKGKDASAPGSCPIVPGGPSCCAPQRISLISSVGTLTVDNLAPFPFPSGVTTIMDVGASAGLPNCEHPVNIGAGGFLVPNFDLPALNYCSSVTPIGCDVGPGLGAGILWDGNGAAGVALTDVTATADTADGVCDATAIVQGTCTGGGNNGNPCVQPPDCPAGVCTGASGCTTTAGGAGLNTLGDIDRTVAVSPGGGVRSLLDIKVHSLTWSDATCSPAITPGCCPSSVYNPVEGDLVITEFDFVLRPTTGTGTGRFVDKNANICKRAGSGFSNPTPDGPQSLSGTAAAGPCCVPGQATTVVSVGVGFSGGAPLYDLGFKSTIPNTVSACGAFSAGTCTPTTDACLQ